MKKDNSKFWCKFCRVFVYDNKVSRANHDKHPGHKTNVERFIREIDIKKTQELKTTNMAKRLLGIRVDQPVASGSNSSLYIPNAADVKDDPVTFHKTFAENKSSVGAVGKWETVAPQNSASPTHVESAHLLISNAQDDKTQQMPIERDKLLELSRSILSSSDQGDTSLHIKSASMDLNDGDVLIKKRQIKGKFTRKK